MTDSNDPFGDIDRLRLPRTQPGDSAESKPNGTTIPKKTNRITGPFLKGPIPLEWLVRAVRLSGKAPLTVALAILFQAGRKRSKSVKLTSAVITQFGIDRKAKYRGLTALEKAGLIQVHRESRRNPVVTLLDVKCSVHIEME